jgi:cyclopropane fatty-acyl-phospholipid synthase-like methyltransferase
MTNDNTIKYYNKNAKAYYNNTIQVNMLETANRFLSYIKDKGTIIDIGAGSGRDMKYFKDKGFMVEGIDASQDLCRLASEYSGCSVSCVKIQDWIPNKRYDGIWACASLVHLTDFEIEDFIRRLGELLEDNGVAYLSFKKGIPTGYDEKGRYFSDYPEEKVQRILKQSSIIELIDLWESEDKMDRDDFSWVNIFLRKHACVLKK